MIAVLRNIPVAKHFMYSLAVHLAILSFLLTLPIYGGNGESAGWYLVYLKNTADINRKEIPAKKTVPTGKGSVKDHRTNRKNPVFPKSGMGMTDVKSAPKKETEEPETTSPVLDELVKETQILWPPDQPAVVKKNAPVMSASKHKEIPKITAPQIKEEPIEKEQGRQVDIESKAAPSIAEKGLDHQEASAPGKPKPTLSVASQTNPSSDETVKEPEIPNPMDQPVAVKENAPVMSASKEKEMPKVTAPQINEGPTEKEQGRQVDIESKTGPLNAAQKSPNEERDGGKGSLQVESNAKREHKARIVFPSPKQGSSENILSGDLLSARLGKKPEPSSEAVPQVEEKKAANNAAAEDMNQSETKEEKPAAGISVPAALFLKDIKIKVSGTGEISGLSVRLLRRAYPADNPEKVMEKQEIEMTDDKGEDEKVAWPQRTFSVARAEKGIYYFLIEDKEEKACNIDVVFRFYEGEPRARIKGYSAVRLLPGKIAKFMFVIPDMIFWDDDDRFSGVIEDSTSVTKFIYDSGLVWKEDKNY
jgi:hypothetical protein